MMPRVHAAAHREAARIHAAAIPIVRNHISIAARYRRQETRAFELDRPMTASLGLPNVVSDRRGRSPEYHKPDESLVMAAGQFARPQ